MTQIIATPIEPQDLEAGDIYSNLDQDFWDDYATQPSIGLGVMVKTLTELPGFSEKLYKLEFNKVHLVQ